MNTGWWRGFSAPVPLENRILLLVCGLVVASGGSAVFVDQAAQYRFSVDSLDIEVRRGQAGKVALAAGIRWAMP